jgi:putative ABC transport system permease protein
VNKWLRYFEFFRRDPRRDIDDEIRTHIEMREADLVARGLTPDAARQQARREFGDANSVRNATVTIDERVMRREQRAEWFATLARDARVTLRSLRSSPGFAVTAVLCAALGIGITTAIVSASYSILARPLPYRDADQLVAIYAENTKLGYKGTNISFADFAAWRDRNRAFSGLAIWTWTTKTLTSGIGDAERLYGADVSWNLFQILGVGPMLGRNFLQEEDAPGRQYEAIISHRLWQRRFAGDATIVGKTMALDGRAWTIVGVMPPSFNFPDRGDLWVPFAADPAGGDASHGNRGYAGAIGRMRPGVTLAQATQDLHRIDADLAREFPNDNPGWRAEVHTLRDDLVGDLRQPLKVFLAAVALVLLLACANIANLMLARDAARAREIAIRSAIGASRSRLVRQLMTESLVVATLGGALGVVIAWWGIRLFAFAFPNEVPFYFHLHLDALALVAAAAITAVTGVLFGVIPALRGTRLDLSATLREGARTGSGVRGSRLRSALVVGEIALSSVLMVGALLLVRSYRNLYNTPLGFSEQGMVSARMTLPKNAGYPTRADVGRFWDQLFERLRRSPNVASVGAAQGIPFSGWDVQAGAEVEGMPAPRAGEEVIAHFENVTPDYFRTIGVQLERGRWLNETDNDSLNLTVLVNETMVARGFHGADPIGKRVRVGGANDKWATVVGVIRDYRHYRLPQPMGPAVYYSNMASPARQMFVVIKAKQGDPHDLVPLLRSAVREIDPNVALFQVQTFDEVVTRSLWRQRLQGNVLGIFAALSLALACLGLYGVISYAVAQRTREFGVRIALGATRGNVMRLVLAHGTRLVVVGIAIGLLGAYFAVRLLATLLYGIQATDTLTFLIVPVCLAIVALLAAAIPSRRATRVDPIIAMRAE